MFVFCLFLLFVVVHGTPMYVSVKGKDDKTCGGEKNPCKSLQTALNNADKNSETVINIEQGTFSGKENCKLDFTNPKVQFQGKPNKSGALPELKCDGKNMLVKTALKQRFQVKSVQFTNVSLISSSHEYISIESCKFLASSVATSGGETHINKCEFDENNHVHLLPYAVYVEAGQLMLSKTKIVGYEIGLKATKRAHINGETNQFTKSRYGVDLNDVEWNLIGDWKFEKCSNASINAIDSKIGAAIHGYTLDNGFNITVDGGHGVHLKSSKFWFRHAGGGGVFVLRNVHSPLFAALDIDSKSSFQMDKKLYPTGGIYITNSTQVRTGIKITDSSATLFNVVISDNGNDATLPSNFAAIEVNQGSLTMDTATITNNQWRSLHAVNMSTVVVLDSVLASNVANLSTIIVDSSELNFHDTRFFRNYYDIRRQPAVVPAGVFMVMNQGKLMLAGSILQDNGFSPQGIQGNGASAFSCTDSSIRLLQSKISETQPLPTIVCDKCNFYDSQSVVKGTQRGCIQTTTTTPHTSPALTKTK